MAQTTSALWKTLVQDRNTSYEYAFDINGVWYGPDMEVKHSVDSELFDDFGIGNATSSTLKIEFFADEIPRGAKIKRYIRLINGNQKTEWLPKGVFFTSRRAEDDGYWTIEAFDAMRKADVVWYPDQSIEFPLSMPDAVEEFSRIMGVQLDPRTQLNENYSIDYPANDYTIREELQYIAAAHGGNWIITDQGKLLLVPIMSAPPETNYLIDEHGNYILIGGFRILV